ncbi:MAG: type IX secretion system membrane protein PorP/SprF [Bacteroidales bacterium]|jgi:type IX secretion system PorP/SprF family membrane protein|nr:type IX secretion system membrane protein PorP/SprF [Bacteroidales bacterium]
MKKYILLWMFGCRLGGFLFAQQIPVTSLFVENPFPYNPAVAGTDNGFKVRMDNRFQWTGFADAPITNQLSAYGPHKNKNIGYGGTIGYDAAGPTGRFTLNGAFASNFALGGDMRLSAGIHMGFVQYRVDGSQLELDSPDDPLRQEDPYAPPVLMSAFLPDAAAGIWLYTSRLHVGFSALQLFNNHIRFNDQDSRRNRLKTHFYGTAGYKLPFGEWMLEPALLLKKTEATPLQLDITARVMFREQFWGGVNVRNTFESFNDLCFIIGYIHGKRLNLGIAYDFSSSSIRPYTNGTIELLIGYNFDDIKNRN